MKRKICIFCSSSSSTPQIYVDSAKELGSAIAKNGYTLVYGGANCGLMGDVANSALVNGGKVIGVIPEHIHGLGITHSELTELHISKNIRERKAHMELLADAFIALPGGFGTLEELMEILTLKQLEEHTKPVVILNIGKHFDPLLTYFDRMIAEHFLHEQFKLFYFVATSVKDALHHIENYTPPPRTKKWY